AYSSANAYLDGLAHYRRGRALPANSIAWGAWAGGGLVDEYAAEQLGRRGLRLLQPTATLAALEPAITAQETPLTVADVDWRRFTMAYPAARARPLLFDLPQAREALAEASTDASTGPGASVLLDELR